jgi:tetratricopeptide (TPR) repeat protein
MKNINKSSKPEPKNTFAKKNEIPINKNVSKSSSLFYTAKDKLLISVIIFIASFILYGNTISLKYALDDTIVITGNEFTKKGFNGIKEILSYDLFAGYFGKDQNMVSGGRYRPLSLITHAIEYQFFGENPAVSHFFNIILLAITGLLIFYIFNRLLIHYFKDNALKTPNWWISVPFATAILFIAHPVHTEVIANIKGRDEILTLLFSLSSLWFIIRWLETNKTGMLISAGLSFFLGLLSKENTLTFIAVIPLAAYYFMKFPLGRVLKGIIPLVIAAVVFFIIRQSVIGGKVSFLADDLMNNPFVEMNFMQKYSTILYTLGLYLKLLFFPHPLTYDYYPYHIPIINPSDLKALIPLLIYIAILVFAIIKIKKRNPYSFAILLYLTTLSITSNVFFPIGAFMNERFIYMSSLAFCFALSWFLFTDLPKMTNKNPSSKYLTLMIFGIILVLYTFKTRDRNRDWYDSKTLFLKDVEVSKNSAKGNALAGEYLIYEAKNNQNKPIRDSLLNQSIIYLNKAIEIYPKQIVALFNLAAAHYEKDRNYSQIIKTYKTILKYLPKEEKVYSNFISVINQSNNPDEKLKYYLEFLAIDSMRFDINFNIGIIMLHQKNDVKGSIPFLKKASEINPTYADAHLSLGEAYASIGLWADALNPLLEANRLKKATNAKLLQNIGIVYTNLRNNEKAKEYLKQAALLGN